MQGGSGTRRTRSQVGPDWSSKEALILVNEIAAVEADCLKALSSYQKWKIISETCTALDVPRTANQCRRKWESLLDEYKMIVRSRSPNKSFTDSESESFPHNFDRELFKAIDDLVLTKDNQSASDPDSDPEADLSEAIAQLGSKRRRRQSLRVKQCAEQKLIKSLLLQEEHQPSDTEEFFCNSHVAENPQKAQVERRPKDSCMEEKILKSCMEEKKQMMMAKLQENAELIPAIVAESADYSDGDMNHVQDLQSDFVRRQGEKLIACLTEIVKTIDQFTDDLQECE